MPKEFQFHMPGGRQADYSPMQRAAEATAASYQALGGAVEKIAGEAVAKAREKKKEGLLKELANKKNYTDDEYRALDDIFPDLAAGEHLLSGDKRPAKEIGVERLMDQYGMTGTDAEIAWNRMSERTVDRVLTSEGRANIGSVMAELGAMGENAQDLALLLDMNDGGAYADSREMVAARDERINSMLAPRPIGEREANELRTESGKALQNNQAANQRDAQVLGGAISSAQAAQANEWAEDRENRANKRQDQLLMWEQEVRKLQTDRELEGDLTRIDHEYGLRRQIEGMKLAGGNDPFAGMSESEKAISVQMARAAMNDDPYSPFVPAANLIGTDTRKLAAFLYNAGWKGADEEKAGRLKLYVGEDGEVVFEAPAGLGGLEKADAEAAAEEAFRRTLGGGPGTLSAIVAAGQAMGVTNIPDSFAQKMLMMRENGQGGMDGYIKLMEIGAQKAASERLGRVNFSPGLQSGGGPSGAGKPTFQLNAPPAIPE